jgi:hypothetical protein
MLDAYIPVSPGTAGKNVDLTEITVGGVTVDRQRMHIGGSGPTELADVKTADPASNAGGLVVRAIGSPLTLNGALSTPAQVTAAASPTQLLAAPLAGLLRLTIQCDSGSAELARIGDSNVGAARGLVLDIGQAMDIDCGATAAALLYVWSSGGTAKINILERA